MDVASEHTIRHGALRIRNEPCGATHVIALQGELDLDNAQVLDDELRRVELSDAVDIVVDLAQLEFIDSTGLRVLLVAARRSAANGDRLSFRHGGLQVERLLELTEIAGELRFER
jgi:anti-anti-sigma factor